MNWDMDEFDIFDDADTVWGKVKAFFRRNGKVIAFTAIIVAGLAAAVAANAKQPGETVRFRSFCTTPDPLAKMSEADAGKEVGGNANVFRAAMARDECFFYDLQIAPSAKLVARLGSWEGTRNGDPYKWSLWEMEFQGTPLYAIFPDEREAV